MDKIIIKDAEILCKIGVSSKERSKKQKLLVSIKLLFNTKKAAASDDIKDTIDYSDVLNLVKVASRKKKHRLIETLASEIAGLILSKFKAVKVIVKIKKNVAGMKYAAVEIEREK